MTVLQRRILPTEAKAVRADLKAMSTQIAAGDRLNLGDTGKAVVALQRQLQQAGLYQGPISGTFDDATQAAVQALQTAKHQAATGEVGTATLAALKKTDLFVKDGFSQPAHVGQRGKDILRAEKKLAELGFLNKSEVDGVFDKETANAAHRYRQADPQVSNKGNQIGAKFYDELSKASSAYHHDPLRQRQVGGRAQHHRLDDLTATKAASPEGIAAGDKGRAVLNVQKHLEAAGYELGKQSGTFGSRTRAALEAFQGRSGLPVTGKVDPATWKNLRTALFAAKSGTSPVQQVGERDRYVLGTEKLLRTAGYKKVKADGKFDGATERAVESFQKKHHLAANGTVNAKTLASLKKVAASKSGGAFTHRLLDLARAQLGTSESPPGSNHQKYSAFFGRGNEPWCADFVSWCYTKAGKKLNQSWTPTLLDMLHKNGTYTRSHPKPGDIVMFDWTPGYGETASHTGIVEKVYSKNGQLWVQTIEGNTSTSNVARRNVPVSWSSIAGFGTIK